MREAILGGGSDTPPRCARNAKESDGLVQIPVARIAGGMRQAIGFVVPGRRVSGRPTESEPFACMASSRSQPCGVQRETSGERVEATLLVSGESGESPERSPENAGRAVGADERMPSQPSRPTNTATRRLTRRVADAAYRRSNESVNVRKVLRGRDAAEPNRRVDPESGGDPTRMQRGAE